MSTVPCVSIIVPFFNSEQYIKDCIESLLHQENVAEPYEVICIDNGSTDRSAAVASAYPEVIMRETSTPGAYAARNIGIKQAKAPLLAFTDADCLVAPDWVSSIRAGMADPDTAILVGQCRYATHASLALRLLGVYENAKTEHVIARCPPAQHFAYANNMAVRASLFDEIGLFKEWQRAGDSELVHRLALRRPDLRLVYQHSMKIVHQEFTTARQRLERLSLYTRTNSQIGTFQELDVTERLQIAWRMLGRLSD